jgi:SulP family sulfate permease
MRGERIPYPTGRYERQFEDAVKSALLDASDVIALSFSRQAVQFVGGMRPVDETSGGTIFMRLPQPRVRFPFVAELRGYTWVKGRADLIAALTLTLVSIPQAIGFALILGLPPATVISSTVVGGFVSALFFSSRYHVFGPTTSICLITAATVAANPDLGLYPLQLAAYLALLIGLAQFVSGLFNFGEVTKFISRSVVVGYTTAIGVLLITSQLPNLVGVARPPGESFMATVRGLVEAVAVHEFSWWAMGICALALGIFWCVGRCKPGWPESLVALGLLGIAARLLAAFHPDLPFRLVKDVGELTRVLPKLGVMPAWEDQMTVLHHLAGSAIAIAVIGMLEATAITKSLAAKSGQPLDSNQELMGMGAGNIMAGLFGVTPGSSSFTRSAVNYQSGAASQLSVMFSSIGVLLVLLFVTPIFNYIPVAALAAYLLRVGYRLISRHQIRVAVGATRSDAVVFFVTLLAALFLRLDTAIYVGIGVSLALFLQKTSTPTLVEYSFDAGGQLAELRDKSGRANPQISIIHVEGELFFGAADLFQDQVRRLAADENIRVFILRMKNARHLDASTVMALESLHNYLRETQRHLLLSGCSADVTRVLRNSGLLARIGGDNVFPGETNPTMATKRALQRAGELLPSKADVRLFYERKGGEAGDAAM